MFSLRTPTMPTIPQIIELERVIIVDQTGPTIQTGVSNGDACLVGEFLKGPFIPQKPASGGDLITKYVGDFSRIDRISQSGVNPSSNVQDGSGLGFDGNGWTELKGKTFRGLVIQRVDTDMVTTDGGTAKAFVAFSITVGAADQTAGVTNKDITIVAGTRFANAAIGSAVQVLSLSQDLYIPAGTTVTTNEIAIGFSFTQSPDTGVLTYVTSGATSGATAFFVKGTTAVIAAIGTIIDPAIAGADAATVIKATGISTINASAAATAIFAATGGATAPTPDTLFNRITACYLTAIDQTLPGKDETNNITDIWSARNYFSTTTGQLAALRAKLWSNATTSSKTGRGRRCYVNPAVATAATYTAQQAVLTAAKALQSEFPGVDADRANISVTYAQVYSSELSKLICNSPSGYRVCMRNNIPEEYQTSVGSPYNAPIQGISAPEPALRAFPLVEGDFIALKAAGVAALVKDRTAGWWFYSGVTAASKSSYSTRVSDNRRAFADFIQDTLVETAAPYAKLPGTTERVDSLVSEVQEFVMGLVSTEVPALQRATAAQVDAESGNTPDLTAIGCRVFMVAVKMVGDLNAIVFKTQIGPTVTIQQIA